jgi:hypothetical protein
VEIIENKINIRRGIALSISKLVEAD